MYFNNLCFSDIGYHLCIQFKGGHPGLRLIGFSASTRGLRVGVWGGRNRRCSVHFKSSPFDGNVPWFHSSGSRCSVHFKSSPFDGNVPWFHSCGNRCSVHFKSSPFDGNVPWFHSCGNRRSVHFTRLLLMVMFHGYTPVVVDVQSILLFSFWW